MKVLAIETACEQGSVALLYEGELLSRRIEGAKNHSEAVLRDIRDLLGEAGLVPAQLDAVAFGAGPGAFTGLRLACGIAQGLALGADLGVAAICSLQALALRAEAPRVFVATDARMGEVYHAAFVHDAENEPQAVTGIGCCAPGEVVLPPGRWSAAGSAFAAWPEALRQRLDDRLDACLPSLLPDAAEVARLAVRRVEQGALLAPEHAAPLYVRDKVALTTAERLARGGRA
ncbi:tRNA (adenosine(37)-N6)-threonylcarbamoyltransferase complex dimerization subunit type 1 TsaB [Thauera aromatica]|nr:tRNA (adenosine(37)-N6)-threonylcarbamoyltransferase complex dimerization subunit type 1 TsaB [Thauera aromatica]MCK2127034.1 tRNA (adenosine(37)-N6)-threonylcarbamoyltransferase complex dimerization subunit type 1 TsaB [Thauera aromatica]